MSAHIDHLREFGSRLFGKSKKGHLLRILGVMFGISVGVGNTIGGGILRTPGEVAGYLGKVWMIVVVWIVGGIYALLCAVSVTELGAMLPRDGGWYVYSRRAFGERVGFIVGCCDWVMQSVADATLAVAFGEFAVALFPVLGSHVTLVAACAFTGIVLVNWIGLKAGSWAQEITSLAKAVGLLGLVVSAFIISPNAAYSTSVVSTFVAAKHGVLWGLILALQGVVVTYDGWYAPIYFLEEDKDPAKNLPRSMIGTTVSCIAIFLLVNAAFIWVLGVKQLGTSQMPAADVSMLLFGAYGKRFILLISAITVISSLNAGVLFSPRILYAMANDGLLPEGIAAVNHGGTPGPALLLCFLVTFSLILIGSFETLIAIVSVLFVAVYLSGFVALLVLRKREPSLPRPYKAWWYPWSTVFVIIASAAFLIGSVLEDLKHALFTAVLVLLTYLASLFVVRPGKFSAPAIDVQDR